MNINVNLTNAKPAVTSLSINDKIRLLLFIYVPNKIIINIGIFMTICPMVPLVFLADLNCLRQAIGVAY